MRRVTVLLLLLVVLAAVLHSTEAAPSKQELDRQRLKDRLEREEKAAAREAAAARDRRRANRKRDADARQKLAEKKKKEADAEAKLDPNMRKKLKRTAERDRRQRALRKRAERVKTRWDLAVRRNAAAARERATKRRHRKAARVQLQKKLDKWLADRRDAESLNVRTKALTKLRHVYKKLNATRSGAPHIWDMNDSDFKEYVFAGPRPYGILIALTALGKQQKCDYCHSVHKLFMPLADLIYADADAIMTAHYNSSVTAKTSKSPYASALNADGEPVTSKSSTPFPVFVLELDVENGRNTFHELGMRGAPSIFYVPPKHSSLMHGAAMDGFVKALGNANQFSLQSDTKLTDLLTWINKVAAKSIDPPAAPLSQYWFTAAPAGVIVALICVVYRAYLFRISWLFRWAALIGGFCLVGFCWGGGWYSILNDLRFNFVWPGWKKFKVLDYVDKGGNSQNGVEGVFYGASQVAFAVLIILLTKRARYQSKSDATPAPAAEAAPESIGTQLMWFPVRFAVFAFALVLGPFPLYRNVNTSGRGGNPVVRTVVFGVKFVLSLLTSPLVLTCAIGYMYMILLRVYTAKNGGYNNGFLHKAPMA